MSDVIDGIYEVPRGSVVTVRSDNGFEPDWISAVGDMIAERVGHREFLLLALTAGDQFDVEMARDLYDRLGRFLDRVEGPELRYQREPCGKCGSPVVWAVVEAEGVGLVALDPRPTAAGEWVWVRDSDIGRPVVVASRPRDATWSGGRYVEHRLTCSERSG